MLCRLLAESAGNFWWPEEFKNVANPDFENLKYLQNPGHIPLTEASRSVLAVFVIKDNLKYVKPLSYAHSS